MILYGTYSANSIEEIVDAIICIHNTISNLEEILSGKHLCWYQDNIEMRIAHMVLISLFYFNELQMKCVNTYKDLINKLYVYIRAIHVFSAGSLPINLISPSQLHEMITQVRKVVPETNSEYDLVIKGLHLHYDMKLVTFDMDDLNLFVQFPVFVHPYSHSPLILYQTERVQVPVIY